MNIKDKVVWITGASSGIGEALVHECYLKGAKIILSARNEHKLRKIANSYQEQDRIKILPLDLSLENSLTDKAKEAILLWNRLDILINNAGISQRSLLSDTENEVIRKIMSVNFMATAILSREAAKQMMKQKSGYILMVSSVAGKFSTPLRTIYSASKMALQGLCDGLRSELWPYNIMVSLIVPGFVKTQISVNALEGKGNTHGLMDPNQDSGITSEKAARIIIKGINRNKREIFMGLVPKTYFALFLKKHFPGLLSMVLRKAKVT